MSAHNKSSKSLQGRNSIEDALELLGLPKRLLWKIGGFVKRNTLAVVRGLGRARPDYRCCESCLKAFMMKEAEKYDRNVRQKVKSALKVEAGHDRYFLDGEKLLRVD